MVEEQIEKNNMDNINQDYELEKKYHPENFEVDIEEGVLNEDDLQEASDLIAVLQDALDDLDRFSARHDDIFNYQVDDINNSLKSCRKQL